ncbi:hypothetical protein J4Q44_G00053050 [Coregonus suidteri]|uniref:Cation/H+ exchanger transmembrane domain-containing protein n=1 Tax=Coregonus suidteri TaxID=861788 RepID=A0AAN8N9W6_9TELE
MTMSDSSSCCSWFSRLRCPRPHGFLAHVITKVCLGALLFGVVWSITEKECYPGGNLFGIIILFLCAVCGGKLVGLIQLPTLPPFPPLLGMLLAGLVLRNVPYVTEAVHIEQAWSAALRNIALAIILTRAGLGLDPSALRRLKAVCVRLAVGPCTVEASTVAVISHFLMGLPWVWGFILGFVLSAVSPAVVVPSMLLLQKDGYGVEKGIPTLLMAAGSFDDILAITGFSTCLGVAFATGMGMACLATGLVTRVLFTFLMVFFGGFNMKEKLFISMAWLPKATVQAAIGSTALDMARVSGDEVLVRYGLDVLTVAVLAILTTAPIGALGIGLAGPRLLTRHPEDTDRKEGDLEAETETPQKDAVTLESKL